MFLAVASFGFHQNVINELSSPAVRFKWDCNIAFLFLAFSMGELMVVKIRSSGCKSFLLLSLPRSKESVMFLTDRDISSQSVSNCSMDMLCKVDKTFKSSTNEPYSGNE